MATKTSILLVDDLDGESEATETVRFGLGETEYEIDLSEANAAQVRETLSKYVSAARKTGSTSRRRGTGRRITTDSIDPPRSGLGQRPRGSTCLHGAASRQMLHQGRCCRAVSRRRQLTLRRPCFVSDGTWRSNGPASLGAGTQA